jgi:hypothetical protein
MKKCNSLIYLVLISSSLNAMNKTPDITQWKEICKNPKEKQQLTTIYKDFCKKRFHEAIPETVTSLISSGAWGLCAAIKVPYSRSCPSIILGSLVAFYAMRKTQVLRYYSRLNQLAIQEDLSYLNHDVLERLGSPEMLHVSYHKDCHVEYELHGRYSAYDYNVMYKDRFGNYQHPRRTYSDIFSVSEINGIEKALSGKYSAISIHPIRIWFD